MMSRRSREPNLQEKNLRRKLGMFDELAWKRKISSADSFSRRETGVVLGSSLEPESPEVDKRPMQNQPSWLSRHTSEIDETFGLYCCSQDEN